MTIIKPVNTLKGLCESRLKEKGSLFVCEAYISGDIEECERILTTVRKKYFDASHHCFAFKLNSGETKYSDNGEPNGSAGIRIFNAIEHFDLTDLIVIVTRYFGGTKLGVGPLGKAYYESAFNTLQSAMIVVKNPFKEIIITTNFEQMGHVYRTLSDLNAKRVTTEYKDNSVVIKCFFNSNEMEVLNTSLEMYSKGDIIINSSSEIVFL